MERTPSVSADHGSRPSHALRPSRLVPAVIAALVIGLLQVFVAVSFAALIFAGDLAPFLARGVGFALFGAVVTGLVVALASSLPGAIGGVQDVSSAVLAVVAANVAAALGAAAAPGARFVTAVAAVALSGLVTGGFLLLLGRFRLGNLVRFLPYPVVGGFLAGTGWLLAKGAVGLMAGVPTTLQGVPDLLQPATLALWAPGLAFALGLFVVLGRSGHFLVLPGTIVGACAVFAAGAWWSGASVAELGARGWLLGPFPEGGLWRLPSWAELQAIDGGVLLAQLPTIATLALVSAVAVLLNAGGLEVATRTDVDLNRELQAAGVANLAAGAGGGVLGFHQLSVSLLAMKLAGDSRLVGVLAAAVAALALVAGASFLGLFPTFVLGGLLLFLGLALLKEWLVDAWARLPRLEYAIVLTIVLAIGAAGFLVGVALGLVAAIGLFTVAYSRIEVVRHELGGAHARSRVTRSPAEERALAQHGDELAVFLLQGFVFFGTAERLLQRVRARLDAAEARPRRLLFDFRRVSGIDATAALSFLKLLRRAADAGVEVGFTGVPPAVREQLVAGGVGPEQGAHFLADLDHGLERHEQDVLRRAGVRPSQRDFAAQLASWLPGEPDGRALASYFRRDALQPGDRLVEQGDPADEVYFVESGSLTAQLEPASGAPVRLETVGAGQVLGELGFFLREPRSASVVVDAPSVVHVLTRDAYARMAREAPSAALGLHQLVVRLLSGRVRHLMGVVQALER